MVTPGAKREAVAHAREHHGVSERRACALVGVSRRVVRYQSIRPDDAPLRQWLRELVAERHRFGYRRLGYLLAREGMAPNHKKLLWIYREEGLRVRCRGGRKRALCTRAPMVLPEGPNQRFGPRSSFLFTDTIAFRATNDRLLELYVVPNAADPGQNNAASQCVALARPPRGQ
jgi:hypothetical protein